MPQRAKSRLGRVRPRRKQPAVSLSTAAHAVAESIGLTHNVTSVIEPAQKYADARLEFYARLAWLTEYTEIYELEAEVNGGAQAVEAPPTA